MNEWRVKILDLIRRTNQEELYKKYKTGQFLGDENSISQEMEEKFREIFNFHIKNNPRYCKFLLEAGFDYNRYPIDLKAIPIISKGDLKKFNPLVASELHSYASSGGSTNQPFKYPLSRESVSSLWPNLWCAFDVCGVKPGEPMLMIMAYPSKKKPLKKTLYHKLSNFYTVSSFELTEEVMREIYKLITNKKLSFIYGYTSSILILLRFFKKENLHLNLKGIFTTSETFIPAVRSLGREVANCDVIDIYGANDGGICAFECHEHAGYHISHFRTVLEIQDGKILLTDVLNKAFPFIRYQVGDIAKGDCLIKEKCKCGRTTFRIKGISGRTNYFFKDRDGKEISVMYFTNPFDDDYSILQYQIVEKQGCLVINLITDTDDLELYRKKYEAVIRAKINLPFRIVLNEPLISLPNQKTPLFIKF